MTVADQSLVSLALDLGKLPASDLDLVAVLTRVCTALPVPAGVAGAVILATEPSEDEPALVASGGKAGWIGEAQRRARGGPLMAVLRSGRPMRTLDLTRSGPPALAAAAGKSGLVSSLVVPLEAKGTVYGAVQLLGVARRPVEPTQVDLVRMLLDVVVARLVDVRALRLARAAVETVAPPRGIEVATTAIPAQRRPTGRGSRTDAPPRAEGRPARNTAPELAAADDGTRVLPARRAAGPNRARSQPEPRRAGRHSLEGPAALNRPR
jgi:GAF domain